MNCVVFNEKNTFWGKKIEKKSKLHSKFKNQTKIIVKLFHSNFKKDLT